MLLTDEVHARCSRFFNGLIKAEELSVLQFLIELNSVPGIGLSHSTLWRLLRGHRGTLWTVPTVERSIAVAAVRLNKPFDEIFNYLLGRECESSLQFMEFERAHFLLPRPDMAARTARMLEEQEAGAREILCHTRIPPVAQMPTPMTRPIKIGA